MGRGTKFPIPQDCKPSDQFVLCDSERVLALYEQETGKSACRISKNVRQWFIKDAKAKGWAGVRFLKDAQSSHGVGCILWIPPRKVNVTMLIVNQLVLTPDE